MIAALESSSIIYIRVVQSYILEFIYLISYRTILTVGILIIILLILCRGLTVLECNAPLNGHE